VTEIAAKGDDGNSTTEPTIIYDFDPNNLPDEYLKAIGLVVASASQTDSIMRDFIGALLKIDNAETIALGAHMSVPLKDDIIRSLTELNAPTASEVDEIDDLLDEIREAFVKRNAFAHNAFARHPGTGEILVMSEKARGSLEVELAPISVDEIRKVASRVYEAGMNLMEFMASRGIGPSFREGPLREPLKRKKKAREQRRDKFGHRY